MCQRGKEKGEKERKEEGRKRKKKSRVYRYKEGESFGELPEC